MSKFRISYWVLIPLVAVTAISCVLHLNGLGASELQGDEASAVIKGIQVIYGTRHPRLLGALFLYGHEPVRALLTVPILLGTGLGEFALRLPNALAAAATPLAVAWLAHLWFRNRPTTLLAAALCACSGGALVNRLAMGVGPFVLSSSLALAGLVHYSEHRDLRALWLSAFSYTSALLCYFDALLLFPGMVAFVLRNARLRRDPNVHRAALAVALTVGLYSAAWAAAPLVALRMGLVSDLREVGLWRILQRGTAGLNDDLLASLRVLALYNGWLYTGLLLAGIALFLARWRGIRAVRSLAAIALPPLLFLFLIRCPTVHVLNFMPLLALMAGYGWSLLVGWKRVGPILLVIVVTVMCGAGMAQTLALQANSNARGPRVKGWGLPHFQGFKAAGALIRSRADPCDLVKSPLDGYVIQLYTGHRPVPAGPGHPPARFALWPLDDPAAPPVPAGYRRAATITMGGRPSLAVYEHSETDSPALELLLVEGESGPEAFDRFNDIGRWLPAQWAGCPIP